MIELRVENRRRMKPGAGPRMALACALVASAFACPPAVAQLPEVPGLHGFDRLHRLRIHLVLFLRLGEGRSRARET